MEKIQILSQRQIGDALKSLPGWDQKNNKISKQFEFLDFMDAINFTYQLAPAFEKAGHHADIHIFYNNVLFELQRYDVGGKITDKDIEVAHEIEKFMMEWKLREKNLKRWKAK